MIMNEENYSINLEIHDTKDVKDNHVNGSLTVVWRDYDKIFKNDPKMVYVSSVESREIKGPHLHKKRNSYFLCIEGKVVFILKDSSGKYFELESNPENGRMVYVPNGMASAHVNISKSTSRVLALADIAWKPNDNEMENVSFEDYDWSKWKEQ